MRRQRRVKIKNRSKVRNPVTVLFLSVICVIFYVTGLSAAKEVNQIGPEGKKGLLPTEEAKTPIAETVNQSNNGQAYDPTGKTDPFKSFIAEQEPVEEKKRKKPKTYLETLDLSQLDLIAIILSPKGNWAMVRDAKGLGYVIRPGTPIGTNEGVVHEIKEKEVIVREQYRDFRGRVNTKDVAKKLLSQQ